MVTTQEDAAEAGEWSIRHLLRSALRGMSLADFSLRKSSPCTSSRTSGFKASSRPTKPRGRFSTKGWRNIRKLTQWASGLGLDRASMAAR